MAINFVNWTLQTTLALGLLAATTSHSAVSAPLFRTYLSVEGNDSNPCTVSAPCRLLPAALAATQSFGEVWILDSANYNTGTVSILQSVSILAVPGAVGSLVANGGDAIDVTGSNGVAITLRNLVFREIDHNQSYNAISIANSGATVLIEGSEFAYLLDGVNASAWRQIDVGSSTFYGNNYGVYLSGSTAAPTTNVQSTVSIGQSIFKQNLNAAIYVTNAAASLSHDTLSNNSYGLFYTTGAYVVLDNTWVTGSLYGVYQQGQGAAYSTGTNSIVGNETNVKGSIGTIAQQ